MAEQQQTNPEAVHALAAAVNPIQWGGGGNDLKARMVAEAILADPAPLLEALAQAGVLEERHQIVCSCGSIRTGTWRPHDEADVHDMTRERCYVSPWKPVSE